MALHHAKPANIPADLDYLSFTWAPQLLAGYRRLAARTKTPLKKFLDESLTDDSYFEALKEIPFEDNARFLSPENPFTSLIPELSDTGAGHGMTLKEWGDKMLSDWAKDHAHQQAVSLDISRLDDLCYSEITHFLTTVSRDFFKDAHRDDLATQEAWEECFQAIKRPRGMLGYRTAFDLWFNGYHIGIAASGASNGGCYVSLSGAGCGLIDRNKAYEVLRHLPAIKITRIDIAVDFIEGQYTLEDFKQMYIDGEFAFNNISPKYHYHEGGELKDGVMMPVNGRTLSIGKRINGKMFRAYEKGRQMGDPDSKWVRGEVEIRSKDREIPLYALQRPADYFAGAYPCLEKVINAAEVVEVTRIQTRKKKVQISYARLVESAQTAYGALINVMKVSKGMTDNEIIQTLIKPFAVPRSLERAAEAVSEFVSQVEGYDDYQYSQ